jgi:TonB family protein
MTLHHLGLYNLGLYVIQVALLVAAASLAASLLRVAMPRARLTYWRAVVFACLMLPLLPVRRIDFVAPVEPAVTASVATATPINRPVAAPASKSVTTGAILPLVPRIWLIGACARGVWLGVGLLRLRRLRRQGDRATLHEDVVVLQRALAPGAELRWHGQVTQPVTFGLRHPIVLLPSRLGGLPLDIQRAVVCHELLHVGRHDWLWHLVEEAVRTVFWFHPAMRWALAQVQLSREETVDMLVVAITGARGTYMNALLLFAPGSNDPSLAPAILFVRHRQLVLRMKAISQEVCMSPLRLAITSLALAAGLVGSSWAVVSAVPLHAIVPAIALSSADIQLPVTASTVMESLEPSPQASTPPTAALEPRLSQSLAEIRNALEDLRMVTAQTPVPTVARSTPRVIKEVKPSYPPELMQLGLSAEVTLSVTIGAAGDVTDVEAASWSMRTTKNDAARTTEAATRAAAQPFVDAAKAAARQWKFAPADTDTTVEISFTFTTRSDAHIGGGVQEGVPGGVIGDVGAEDVQRMIRATSAGVGAGVGGGIGGGIGGGVPGGVVGGVAGTRMPGFGATTPRPGEVLPANSVKVLRVGGTIRVPRKIIDVKPVYPEDARAANVQGVVILQLRIATDGSVADARILRSIPMLDEAALDAVRQWRYEPTDVDGDPVELVMHVTVNFAVP